MLLSELFEVINDGSSNDTEEIALGMTFFLVGGVGLSAHIVWLRRRFSRNSNEKLSAGWWICTSAIELSALVVGIFASIEVLKWVIASDQFSASALSALLVVKIIWFANWFYTKERKRCRTRFCRGAAWEWGN